MKKFLKHILLFLPFFGLIYLLLLTIWGGFCPQFLRKNMLAPQGLHFSHERLQEAKTIRDIDILFLGNSRTYRGFDTRIFQEAGFQVFNLGTSSQTFLQTELLLRRYLQQMNPKLVVLEVSFEAFMSDGLESAMNIIANDIHDQYTWEMLRQYDDIRLYNTWLYAAIWRFMRKNRIPWEIDTFQKGLYARLKGADTYISGGFVEKELRFSSEQHNYRETSFSFNEKMFEAFERCLDLCRQNGSEVILVLMPYPEAYYKTIRNRNYFNSRIKSHNIPYYNFNYLLPLDAVLHFYDAIHLNQHGVELFSSELVRIISSLEIL